MCLKMTTGQVPFSASLLASQNAKVYLFQEALLSYTNLKIKFTCMGLVVWSLQLRFYTLSNSLLVLMCCLPIHVRVQAVTQVYLKEICR